MLSLTRFPAVRHRSTTCAFSELHAVCSTAATLVRIKFRARSLRQRLADNTVRTFVLTFAQRVLFVIAPTARFAGSSAASSPGASERCALDSFDSASLRSSASCGGALWASACGSPGIPSPTCGSPSPRPHAWPRWPWRCGPHHWLPVFGFFADPIEPFAGSIPRPSLQAPFHARCPFQGWPISVVSASEPGSNRLGAPIVITPKQPLQGVRTSVFIKR